MRYSPSTGSMYPDNIKYKELPADIVNISAAQVSTLLNRPGGSTVNYVDKELVVSAGPPLPEPDPLELRARCYADPLTGSDKYFNEAKRMQLMGEPGWEDVVAQGKARYLAIKEEYPCTTE